MKPEENYRRCEHCDRMIRSDSPPSKESYAKGQVDISKGRVLLPPKVVEANHREGYTDSHAASIEGVYCDMHCLMAKLNELFVPRKKSKDE